MRNVVAGSASSALTPSARSLKPSSRPLSARKNTLRSSSRSTPVSAPEHREDDARPAADDLRGEARRGEEDLQRAALEEAREAVGGVEEVQRVARRRGVEHEHVEAPGAVELVELGDRRELLRARDRARELLVDAVGEDVVARCVVGREALDELVERALGVEHHRPQLAAHLDAVAGEAVGVDEARLVAELVEAERVGQPLGGVDRDDGDALRPPRRAPSRAPPRSSSCPRRPSPRRSRRACPRSRARSQRALQRPRERRRARRASSSSRRSTKRQRRDRRAPPGGAGARAGRAARGRARAARARGAHPGRDGARGLERRAVGGVEAVGQQAVGDDERRPRGRASSGSASSQRERLVDRHLLGAGDGDDAGLRGVGEHRVDHPALAGDAAHARGVGERARRGQHRHAVAGRRRVEDDEVVGLRRPACGGRPARAPRPSRP